jgi:hypothetical protein
MNAMMFILNICTVKVIPIHNKLAIKRALLHQYYSKIHRNQKIAEKPALSPLIMRVSKPATDTAMLMGTKYTKNAATAIGQIFPLHKGLTRARPIRFVPQYMVRPPRIIQKQIAHRILSQIAMITRAIESSIDKPVKALARRSSAGVNPIFHLLYCRHKKKGIAILCPTEAR